MIIKPILLFFHILTWSAIAQAKGVFDTDTLIPQVDFLTPKNIIFCTQGAGSSHHFWVLEIMKELYHRGHNVSFHTSGDQMVFGDDYPMIETRQLGQHDNFIVGFIKEGMIDHPSQLDMGLASVKHATTQYNRLFRETQEIIRERKVDLVIADAFALASADAAMLMNVPVVLTSTFTAFPDSDQPYVNNNIHTIRRATINDETLYTRLYNKFYVPYAAWRLTHKLKSQMKFQRKQGLPPAIDTTSPRYGKVTKLINNAFGLEIPRKTGHLINMVGPILRSQYPNMDAPTAEYLASHNRTLYIAFGQHTMPSPNDLRLILTNVLRLKREGYYNGIIWARLDPATLPDEVDGVTKSEILEEIYTLRWAPQYAILQHPSTVLFLGHGGIGSIHESLYSRVPLFIYSFFADQPYNGHMVKRLGVGEQFDTIQLQYTPQDTQVMYERLRDVLVDRGVEGKVERFANYLQIMSQHSIQRGVDTLEACLFASDEAGLVGHLQGVEGEVSWVKRHSLDLYAVMVSVVVFVAFVGYQVVGVYLKMSTAVDKKGVKVE